MASTNALYCSGESVSKDGLAWLCCGGAGAFNCWADSVPPSRAKEKTKTAADLRLNFNARVGENGAIILLLLLLNIEAKILPNQHNQLICGVANPSQIICVQIYSSHPRTIGQYPQYLFSDRSNIGAEGIREHTTWCRT
jgi:hypothetical protein